MVALLPKIGHPSLPKHLRPIALSSHVAKCYARRELCQLVKEWHADAVFLKTDIKKAFDAADRVFLARRLVGWTGKEYPSENRSLLRLLVTNDMDFQLPWQAFQLLCNTGVRQGSAESLGLFSKLVDSILIEISQPPADNPFSDVVVGEAAFMDDLLCWRRNMVLMQKYADTLMPHASFGASRVGSSAK